MRGAYFSDRLMHSYQNFIFHSWNWDQINVVVFSFVDLFFYSAFCFTTLLPCRSKHFCLFYVLYSHFSALKYYRDDTPNSWFQNAMRLIKSKTWNRIEIFIPDVVIGNLILIHVKFTDVFSKQYEGTSVTQLRSVRFYWFAPSITLNNQNITCVYWIWNVALLLPKTD